MHNVALTAVNLFTELLWGSGAIYGHLLIVVVLIFLASRGGAGKLGAVLVAIVMMVQVFQNMPGTNDAYIFAVVYLFLAIGLGLNSLR